MRRILRGSGSGKLLRRGFRIERDQQTARAGNAGQPPEFFLPHDGKRHQDVVEPGAGHHFRFTHFGDRQAHGAVRQLEARNLHRLVRFRVRAQTHALPAAQFRHPVEVPFQGVKINR